MKVRAIKAGFYNGNRMREGAEFVLSDARHFSSQWMAKASGPVPAPVKVAVDREPETFSEMNRQTVAAEKKVRDGKEK